jgi:uncharacterized protein Yka (UPF0111/DUF47 family)
MDPLGSQFGKIANSDIGKVVDSAKSAVNSVTEGVGKIASDGIASAKTAFENVITKTDQLAKGAIDLAISGIQKAPGIFFKEVQGLSKAVTETAKQVQNAVLDVNQNVKSVQEKLNSPAKGLDEKSQKVLQDMSDVTSNVMNIRQQLFEQHARNIRG